LAFGNGWTTLTSRTSIENVFHVYGKDDHGRIYWNANSLPRKRKRNEKFNIYSVTEDNQDNDMEMMERISFDGEIVGAGGRLGSLLARKGNLYHVAKNEPPGYHSHIDKPIFVTTPASAISSVIHLTPSHRWPDLVLICNGIFSKILNSTNHCFPDGKELSVDNLTIAVPHFGVLSVDAEPIGGGISSPPTVIYGKHANVLQSLLHPLHTLQVSSANKAEIMAVRKLLWASVLWLFSNSHDPPISVDIVHETKQSQLSDLVEELLPAARILAQADMAVRADRADIGTLKEVLEYLESYSNSMPGAKPNKDLAISEIKERNGQFLSVSSVKQPIHEGWIKRVTGLSIKHITS